MDNSSLSHTQEVSQKSSDSGVLPVINVHKTTSFHMPLINNKYFHQNLFSNHFIKNTIFYTIKLSSSSLTIPIIVIILKLLITLYIQYTVPMLLL